MSPNIKFTLPDRNDDPDNERKRPSVDPPTRSMGSSNGRVAGIRLGVMCLMLVMVIWAMNRAARPESWNWLFGFGQVGLTQDEQGGGSGDTNSSASANFESVENAQTNNSPTVDFLPGNADSETTIGEIERRFWRQVLRQMDGPQQIRLFNLIEAATKQTRLKPGSTASIHPVLNRLERSRAKFSSQLEPSDLSDEFRQTWSTSLLPAFVAVIGDNPETDKIDAAVRDLADHLQKASRDLIKDKTPIDRGKEAYAWFSAWSGVFDQPIEQDTNVHASVTQLLSQPKAWRDQLIKISGTALRVERVDATHNALGIERYYVVWIKPDHPSIYPYCVYTLMAPESLMGEPGEKMRVVEQRVKTTARFFKNRLFNADNDEGSEAAFSPVLLTTAVEFPEQKIVASRPRFQLPSRNVVYLSIGLIGGLAILIAVSVYRSTTGGRSLALPKTERLRQNFTELQTDDRIETTAQKLQRMGQRDSDADSPAKLFEPDMES